ncbi:MAG: TRAP transporter small permease [Aliarcobacter sp.]|jgi:C4-dicarboxylate transporter DctQ subunit|nr:TRAP transporter small permease [Aliarcobacter sp.]MBP6712645.1 TRAP transporter small permease [Aliarcobacter sp.]MBP7225987.1 TRAP transporter small permease [Aliarcobacter sp.]MDX9961022.1 TRAP transporter small permease [Aliarcobacter sp.]
MKKFFQIIDIIVSTINQTMAVLGLSLGVLLAFINVILRYAFDMSLTWAAELTNYLFIWAALFGAAYGFKQGAHISVSLIIEKFPPAVTKGFLMFANLVSIIYLALISYFGYQLVLMLVDFGEMSIDLEIPLWIPHLVLPIAFALAAYRSAEKLVEIYKTDSSDVKIFSEHEAVIHEVKSQGEK